MGANRIRELRLAAGLTQGKLAKRAELRPETVCRLENGLRKPYRSTAQRIADVLGVPVDSLFLPESCPQTGKEHSQ
jgi:transcriptional regulator with XRE-family HTH domain